MTSRRRTGFRHRAAESPTVSDRDQQQRPAAPAPRAARQRAVAHPSGPSATPATIRGRPPPPRRAARAWPFGDDAPPDLGAHPRRAGRAPGSDRRRGLWARLPQRLRGARGQGAGAGHGRHEPDQLVDGQEHVAGRDRRGRAAMGRLDIRTPPPVPEWAAPEDPRHAITWENLLHMTSGLAWIEDYVDGTGSDVIEMLFGKGSDDMAAFAASFPAVAEPDTRASCYSSGTSNLLARALQTVLGIEGDEAAMREFLAARAVRSPRHDLGRPPVRPGGHVHRLVVRLRHHARLRPLRAAVPARRHVGRAHHRHPRVGRPRPHPDRVRHAELLRLRRPGGPTPTSSAPSAATATRASASPSSPPATWWWSAWARPRRPTTTSRRPPSTTT